MTMLCNASLRAVEHVSGAATSGSWLGACWPAFQSLVDALVRGPVAFTNFT